MDESVVREHAEAHGQAIVDGDTNRAGSDLTRAGMEAVGPVMKAMPQPVTKAEVQSVESKGDSVEVLIRYTGTGDETLNVRSVWVDEGGRPKISDLSLP
jgi:hypothetical protein